MATGASKPAIEHTAKPDEHGAKIMTTSINIERYSVGGGVRTNTADQVSGMDRLAVVGATIWGTLALGAAIGGSCGGPIGAIVGAMLGSSLGYLLWHAVSTPQS